MAWLCAAWLAAVALAAAAADTRELQERIDTDLFDLPAPISLGERLRLWATWYHVHSVDAIPDGVRLLDVAGAPISPPVPGRDWCLGALQQMRSVARELTGEEIAKLAAYYSSLAKSSGR